jgi:hypothetical protein
MEKFNGEIKIFWVGVTYGQVFEAIWDDTEGMYQTL